MYKQTRILLTLSILILFVVTSCSSKTNVVQTPAQQETKVTTFNTQVSEELRPIVNTVPKLNISNYTISKSREILNSNFIKLEKTRPKVDGVIISNEYINRPSSPNKLRIRTYQPELKNQSLPALLWMHAGGLIAGTPEQDDHRLSKIAKDANMAVFSVNYRLAPEHKYPAAIEDSYVALQWLIKNAQSLGIDPSKIGVGGAGAGGGIATALALMERDKNEFKIRYQLLIYPMLDDTNIAQASETVPDSLLWSRQNNLYAWSSYLDHPPGSSKVSKYAAAARAKDLSNFPPTFIAVGDADLFYEEGTAYANRLKNAGVATSLNVYKGAFHGFDLFPGKMTRELNAKIINEIKLNLSPDHLKLSTL
ncbi:MAG: alpha/beta hydrolase [Bacteriovoracaceae bacterium]|nr:alpha/beta hydrolase [Bacteriovoracaceae bacterium]